MISFKRVLKALLLIMYLILRITVIAKNFLAIYCSSNLLVKLVKFCFLLHHYIRLVDRSYFIYVKPGLSYLAGSRVPLDSPFVSNNQFRQVSCMYFCSCSVYYAH